MKKLKLNLPKTKFSMKADLINKQTKILDEWNKFNIYKYIINNTKNRKKFILHDGPIYSNGSIHIGHILNKVIKDAILKSKRLSNYYCEYIPGWDCHGLPIELNVYNNIDKNKYNNESLIRKFREYSSNIIFNQRKDLLKLGIIGDWNNYYYTMSKRYELSLYKIFCNIYKLNYIEGKNKPFSWCIKCNSTLSDFEINYKKTISISIYIKFKITNYFILNNILNNKYVDNYLIIWTTTPWTLFDNEAISVNPDLIYEIFLIDNKYIYIFIKNNELFDYLKLKYNILRIGSIKGVYLKEIKLLNILNKTVNIIFDKDIEFNIGTGIVHIAPGHGISDYELGIKNKLNIINSIDKNGYFTNKITDIFNKLKNIHIFDSIDEIIKILKLKNIFLYNKEMVHEYPYCYRHNYKVIFRITFQWFINLNKNNLIKRLINFSKSINWIPSWGKNNMINMIINRNEWCISRQRLWGIPITIFIGIKDNKPHPNTLNLFKKIYKILYKYGIESWWKLKPEDFNINSNEYKKVNDVLDVWFDSGSSNLIVINKMKLKNFNIPDLYVEGVDQFRGWFMSSLIISSIFNKKAYKSILFHKFIIDNRGNKISKSLNNDIYKNILEKYSSDIIRLWILSNNYKTDITINNESFNRIEDIYIKIRNCFKFALGNIYDFKDIDFVKYKDLLNIDIFMISIINNIQNKIIKYYNEYNFYLVINLISNFISTNLNTYIDIIKDRLYVSKKKSINRRSCQTVLYILLECMVRWIFPILSFTSYEVYKYLNNNINIKKIFITEWYKINFSKNNKYLINNILWKFLFKIKNKINKIIDICIKNNILNNSLESNIIIITNDKFKLNLLNIIYNELKFIFIVSKVLVINTNIKNIIINNNEYFYISKTLDIKFLIKKITDKKCIRCWNYFYKNEFNIFNNKNICNRCINNLFYLGETRIFA